MESLTCRQRIAEKRSSDHATQTERKIARYLSENLETALRNTLLELAEDIGVSDASVVRFCKSIGYKGFQEFKINAALECVPATKLYNPSVQPGDSVREVCDKIFSSEISALEQTQHSLDMRALEMATTLLTRARRITFVGTGGSILIARDAQHKFLKIGLQVTALEDKDMQMMQVSLMGSQDVLFAVSHSGTNLHVMEMVRIAKRNGVAVVALLSNVKNPIAEAADCVLCTKGEKTIFESESVSTRLSQLAVVDTLVALSAFRDYDKSFRAIQQTRKATSNNKA